MDHSETIRALAQITDQGLFERLATAVLRQAEPSLYGNLSHPGMTPTGKTRRSPVDGIAFVLGAHPPHMVVAHHASGKNENLRKKWLNDPARVKKRGLKATAPAGDIIKTISIANEERKRTANLIVTLALTTNQEPTEDLIRDAQAHGKSHEITIDPWSGSRIAHHLDNTPEGQWLRYQYLGISQQQLSAPLLAHISRQSLLAFPLMESADAFVERQLDRVLSKQSPRPLALVIGESGFGKTIACYKQLKNHIDAGGYGLVMSHNTVAAYTTLNQALDSELRALHPGLEPNAGAKALSLCSPDNPLLIIVEDVNWADRPSLLLERLLAWAVRSDSSATDWFNWRLLCPVWPHTIAQTSEEAKKRLDAMTISVTRFNEDESRLAVERLAQLANETMSGIQAAQIAADLAHDPLLIALHHFGDRSKGPRVIGQFVEKRLRELCTRNGSLTLTDFRLALQAVGKRILTDRQMDPTWRTVREWLRDQPDSLGAIRQVVNQGKIVRMRDVGGVEHLQFRHDRVREWLLSETAAELITGVQLDDNTIAEPFFAEVIGSALTRSNIRKEDVVRVSKLSPQALFHALKIFREQQTVVHEAILQAIYLWLADEATHGRANRSLRWAALEVLAESESSHVIPITDRFRDGTWARIRARFRNGDLSAGIELCWKVDPGATATWRDREIEHVNDTYGNALVEELSNLLRNIDITERRRVGALRLSGHLGQGMLVDAIRTCWANDTLRTDHLEEYLWAAARCGGTDPERLLAPICTIWSGLSDQPQQPGRPSPREKVGQRSLSWAFHQGLPAGAVKFLVRRGRRNDLRWPMTLLLRDVNDADAVEFVARAFAAQSRSARGGYWHFPGDVQREWERRQSDLGKPMLASARQRLLDLWKPSTSDKYIRRYAFLLWSATVADEDLGILRSITRQRSLSDDILWARIRRSDSTAVSQFLDKLRGEHASYWWQLGRYTWFDAMTSALEEELRRRQVSFSREWNSDYDSDWIIAELIETRFTPDQAEHLLQQNWEHLRYSREFIEAALLIATPKTCALVADAIGACPDPRPLFAYVQSHFNPKVKGGRGFDRIAQAEAFVPYLDWLEPHAVFSLWDTCNRLGWYAFRRQYLDSRLDETFRERTILDEGGFFRKLDERIARGGEDWADFFIDRYLEQTDRIEDIIVLLEKWLRERSSMSSLNFVAAVLRHIGVRRHLQLLTIGGIEPMTDVQAIRADTIYAVCRRSLT
jgi:hypothetical protein